MVAIINWSPNQRENHQINWILTRGLNLRSPNKIMEDQTEFNDYSYEIIEWRKENTTFLSFQPIH